jgi:hypothetical protein
MLIDGGWLILGSSGDVYPSHVGIAVGFGRGSGRREHREPIPGGSTTASMLSTSLRPLPGPKPKHSFAVGIDATVAVAVVSGEPTSRS